MREETEFTFQEVAMAISVNFKSTRMQTAFKATTCHMPMCECEEKLRYNVESLYGHLSIQHKRPAKNRAVWVSKFNAGSLHAQK